MMRKKFKKANRSRRPPLTLVDKSIYWIGLLLSFIGSLLFAYCFEDIAVAIAFRDSSVAAYTSHASFLLVVPLLMYVEISAFVFFITALEEKKPVFGSKKFPYGEAPWDKDCFPLFDSRRKRVYVSPSKKRFRRNMTMVWMIGLILCALPAPFGLFSRDCLTDDNCIITYNLLNQKNSSSYTTDDFSDLLIQTKHVSGYRSASYWKYEIIIEMKDGKSFAFSNRDFDWRRENCQELCLDKMLEIKSLFPSDLITIEGEHNIGEVVDFLGLNDQQAQLLRELFQ